MTSLAQRDAREGLNRIIEHKPVLSSTAALMPPDFYSETLTALAAYEIGLSLWDAFIHNLEIAEIIHRNGLMSSEELTRIQYEGVEVPGKVISEDVIKVYPEMGKFTRINKDQALSIVWKSAGKHVEKAAALAMKKE